MKKHVEILTNELHGLMKKWNGKEEQVFPYFRRAHAAWSKAIYRKLAAKKVPQEHLKLVKQWLEVTRHNRAGIVTENKSIVGYTKALTLHQKGAANVLKEIEKVTNSMLVHVRKHADSTISANPAIGIIAGAINAQSFLNRQDAEFFIDKIEQSKVPAHVKAKLIAHLRGK
ncbi:MAG: hypothetical protein V1722_01670 [Candidatus Micrarchaeota archaeon]